MSEHLNISFIRSQFPALSGSWTYFDNAGGTQTPVHVGHRIQDYLYHTNVQLGASYKISEMAGQRVKEAQSAMAEWIHASDTLEIVLGPSTTQLLQNLAKSMVRLFKPGDEVIVTDCDHEANIGPWMCMEQAGIVIKTWKIRPDTLKLHLEDLEPLMTTNTRLVTFTHVSNILGTINPVKKFASFIRERGALVCVDGVAAAPHRLADVLELGVDLYVFSFYKVFGPHYSLLYGKRELLEKLPGINHYFIGMDDIPYKLQPGNVNFEMAFSLLGVTDYFREVASVLSREKFSGIREPMEIVYDRIASHEAMLGSAILEFLKGVKGVRIIGETDANPMVRVPTISFVSDRLNSDEIVKRVDPHHIGIRYGDFYARRLIESLGLSPKKGVVRVSMVHYNTVEEVHRLIEVLDKVL